MVTFKEYLSATVVEDMKDGVLVVFPDSVDVASSDDPDMTKKVIAFGDGVIKPSDPNLEELADWFCDHFRVVETA